MKFRKKPVVIEAVRFDGTPESLAEIIDMAQESGCVIEETLGGGALMIHTPEGLMTCLSGEWVIRGVAGELYPCNADIFEATYEPVEELEAGR